ncbi:DUF4238 domain-containing protein [Methylobacterium sp. CCH5-D2]|uniref:DUF4238 domain-containing protein n=1 Tax=Methylobacterium sp. CCH5-D2 TaxID=1768765 RepID=UPI0018D1FD6C|nr:DUF4238 domain-containing protein [Methylobacterium sp. CCH5-D2]
MANKKRQHFIPKYVLRNFAVDGHKAPKDRKQIALYNLNKGFSVRAASLKEQCYRDYMYGKDLVLEDHLGIMEGVFGEITTNAISRNALSRSFDDIAAIAFMVALQKGRTAASEDDANSMVDKMMKMVAYGRFPREQLEQFKIGLTNAAGINITAAMRASPVIFDLKQKLILNKTKTPFVLSDNPVCMTNFFAAENSARSLASAWLLRACKSICQSRRRML